MFSIYRRNKETKDDILGTLTFSKSGKHIDSYWNVDRKLKSENEIVKFYIYNDRHGISIAQRELILLIEENYSKLISDLHIFLNNNVKNSILVENLELNSISIPKETTQLNIWTINFLSISERLCYEIFIKDWNPIKMSTYPLNI